MTALLSLDGAGVRYGAVWALAEVDLAVQERDLIAVIGADGAGKSTLIRLMAGLLQPGAGRIVRSVKKERVGYSGADFDLYPDLTVDENLAFMGTVRGLDRALMQVERDRLLDLTGLADARDRLAGRLSGGMKKKLGLAAALIHSPALLLLDEPTIGVDPGSRRELWDIVAQAGAGGAAVVFTSSYLDEAERARRVIMLTQGIAREVSVAGLLRQAAGWRAWVLPAPDGRHEIRQRLAAAAPGPLVYVQEEGLAVLARDAVEAAGLLGRVMGDAQARADEVVVAGRAAPAAPRGLSLEDAFVIAQLGSTAVPAGVVERQ